MQVGGKICIMQRIETPNEEKLGLVRIFREDLEKIVSFCRQKCQNVEIVADEFKIHEISEIDSQNRNQISRLRVEGFSPRILIKLSTNDAAIWIADTEDVVLKGMKANIMEVLNQKKRIGQYLSWLGNSFVAPMLGSMFSGSFLFIVFTRYAFIRFGSPIIDKINQFHLADTLLVISIILTFLLFIFDYQNNKNHSQVYLLNSSKMPNFLSRKKDDLVLIVFSSLISIAGTLFIQWFFRL